LSEKWVEVPEEESVRLIRANGPITLYSWPFLAHLSFIPRALGLSVREGVQTPILAISAQLLSSP
jgi:hypothetical protein